ncbi:hypothetical protein MNBD_GAMMA12-293 [hydrothermal vent metagenome]|uniref:LysM domain-containing protein n=1 Tax=hydrothermal vent metagenome TaxID=652676 RepID=A0A3B0XQR1_9ZZZZ
MTRKWALIIGMIASLGLVPMGVWSLGLGDADLKSYLNQPINVEIEILTIDQAELKDMTVRLASESEFKRAGIVYSASLNLLKFRVIRKKNGKTYILILSGVAFKEPYLNLLLVVKWPKGKILREYALLIDPPVSEVKNRIIAQAPAEEVKKPEETVPPKVEQKSRKFVVSKTPEPETSKPNKEKSERIEPRIPQPDKYNAPFYAGADKVVKKKIKDDPTAPGNQFPRINLDRKVSVSLANTSDAINDKSYRVKRGDTMMAIAKRIRGNRKISLHQTMMAIKRANPNAFVNNNVHLVKAGRKLVIPDNARLATVSHLDAMKSYRADTDIFKQGSNPVSVAAKQDDKKSPNGQTDGSKKATSKVASNTKVAVNGRFQVLPPNESSVDANGKIGVDSKTKGSKNGSIDGDETAKNKEAVASNDETNPSYVRSKAEKLILAKTKSKRTSRLIGIKNSTMNRLQRSLAIKDYCKDNHDRNCFAVAGFKKVNLAALENKGKNVSTPFKQEVASAGFMAMVKTKYASWMNYLKENPMMAALVGGGVLFTLILLFLILRQIRRSKNDFHESILDFEDEQAAEISQPAPQQAESKTVAVAKAAPEADSMVVDAGGASQSSYLSDFVVSNMDSTQNNGESDPLTEADVFYAYGKYEAAEMLIKESMQAEPNRLDLRYKLLDIYHGAKNREAFEYEASTLSDMLGGQADPMWDKVVEMGRELSPGHALFSDGSTPAAAIPPATAQAAGQDFDLDFDFDDIGGGGSTAANNITSSLESELAAIENDMNAESDFANTENVVSFDMGDASDLLSSTDNDLDPYDSDSTLMSDVDEVGTKLDLAKAYIDMGDPEGARSILDEVLEEGTDQQKGEAEELMQQMASG